MWRFIESSTCPALQFDPDRWSNPDVGLQQSESPGAPGFSAFVPFGIGPKACLAQQLAYVQCRVLLVLLLSTFTWKVAPRMGEHQDVMSRVRATLELRVEGGIWLSPTLRCSREDP
jgi:cytochrome P450